MNQLEGDERHLTSIDHSPDRFVVTSEAIIVLVKLLHTAIFLFVSGCILYVLVCGITGRTSPRPMNAAALVPIVVAFYGCLTGANACWPALCTVFRVPTTLSPTFIFPVGFRAG